MILPHLLHVLARENIHRKSHTPPPKRKNPPQTLSPSVKLPQTLSLWSAVADKILLGRNAVLKSKFSVDRNAVLKSKLTVEIQRRSKCGLEVEIDRRNSASTVDIKIRSEVEVDCRNSMSTVDVVLCDVRCYVMAGPRPCCA